MSMREASALGGAPHISHIPRGILRALSTRSAHHHVVYIAQAFRSVMKAITIHETEGSYKPGDTCWHLIRISELPSERMVYD